MSKMFAHSYYWNFPSISYDLEFLLEISSMVLQVNRIRELPQNSKIVATHTDSPDVCNVSFVSFFFSFLFKTTFGCFAGQVLSNFRQCLGFLFRLLAFSTRYSFGMLKPNLIDMLCWELKILVQTWCVFRFIIFCCPFFLTIVFTFGSVFSNTFHFL